MTAGTAWADAACDRFERTKPTRQDFGAASFDRFILRWGGLVADLKRGAIQEDTPHAQEFVKAFANFHDAMAEYRRADSSDAVEAKERMLKVGIVAFRAAERGGFRKCAALIAGPQPLDQREIADEVVRTGI